MSGKNLKIEISQRFHRRFEVDFNSRIIEEVVRGSEADLIIFPEMFLTGYTLGSDVNRLAVGADSDLIKGFEDIAKDTGKWMVFGFPERSPDIRGQIHNTAVVIGPEGVEGLYRKLHLVDFGPFEEYAYYAPGRDLTMVDINGMRFGIMICYDIFFPELSKYYALNGADGIICISASPSMTRRFFEIVMKARAVENTVFFVYSNLVGLDSRMDFWGGGAVIGPRGDMIAKGPYYEEASISAELDPGEIHAARRLRPTIRDTRSDVLRKLSETGGLR